MTTIAIFGSGSVQPGDTDYQTAYQLGYRLGEAGFIVMTGGYLGIMEAASKGAVQANAHVIGVTYGEVSRLSDPVNEWVQEEIRYKNHNERLLHLVKNADGYVILPGGYGTQREFTTLLDLMGQGRIPVRTAVMLGDFWRQTITELFVDDTRGNLKEQFVFVQSPQEAVKVLQQADHKNNG